MKKKPFLTISLVLLFVAMFAAVGTAETPSKVSLEPGIVSIGAMYNGAQVTLKGTVPASSQVFVEVEGDRETTVLSKKGKAFGLLWMNMGEIEIENAPVVYMLNLPEGYKVEENTKAPWNALGLGFDKLGSQATITSPEGKVDKEADFKEFVKLKEKEGLYAIHENAVNYMDAKGASKTFSCDIFLPPRMKQGEYTVRAVVVQDGQVIEKSETPLKIQRVGIPEFLAKTAFEHGTLYGVIASVIAILAGLGMGLIFGGDGGSH